MQIDPFLRWAGGKRWLWPHLVPLLPSGFKRYIEPFVGSGAIFFNLQPTFAYLSDVNADLINTFITIKHCPGKVLDALQVHHELHSDKYYYDVRDKDFQLPQERAAKFLYLNRTCWNALYRVNAQGRFNVPRGTKDIVVYPTDDFHAWSQALQTATLFVADFEDALEGAGDGDFIYADPPYVTSHNLNGFRKYNERIFSWKDQIRLRDCVVESVRRGATAIVSNASHESIRDLYSSNSTSTFINVQRQSVIAAAARHRRQVAEMVILLRPNR